MFNWEYFYEMLRSICHSYCFWSIRFCVEWLWYNLKVHMNMCLWAKDIWNTIIWQKTFCISGLFTCTYTSWVCPYIRMLFLEKSTTDIYTYFWSEQLFKLYPWDGQVLPTKTSGPVNMLLTSFGSRLCWENINKFYLVKSYLPDKVISIKWYFNKISLKVSLKMNNHTFHQIYELLNKFNETKRNE